MIQYRIVVVKAKNMPTVSYPLRKVPALKRWYSGYDNNTLMVVRFPFLISEGYGQYLCCYYAEYLKRMYANYQYLIGILKTI